MEPSACRMRVRVVYSIIGISAGLSAFIVFGVNYNNWNTALWALLSGIVAMLNLIVHICYLKKVWETYYGYLKSTMLLGCFIQLAGVCGFVVYLTLAITNHQGLIIDGQGYYLSCVWCFMTWKWGFYLFFTSRSYRRLYIHMNSLISEYPYHTPPHKSYSSTN